VIRRIRLHAFARRFSEALEYAAKKHAAQLRKGTRIPYVSHVMAAASLVLEHGGGEDEAIAALLHDIPEDCGGRADLDEIRRRFGGAVARIVEGCTDTFEKPKPPWRRRKEAYLAHLATASKSVLLVSAADKVHNARSILSDYREQGEKLWERFNAGREGQLWYYRELVKAFRSRGSSPLVDELDRVVTELERLTRRPPRRTAGASRR
jgi:GTP pyrophosphokinase